MRQFYLHERHNGIVYAELIDPVTRKKFPAKSTGTRNRDEAVIIVAAWLANGVPNGREQIKRPLDISFDIEAILKSIRKSGLNSDDAMRIVKTLTDMELIDISAIKHGNGSVLFTEFLKNFWTYDVSPYVKDLKLHNHSIGKSHCQRCLGNVVNNWKPIFEGKRLNEITKQDLRDFSFALTKATSSRFRSEKVISKSTVNKIMITGITALKWAFSEGMIPVNPSDGYKHFGENVKERGVLTPSEAEKVFASQWENKHAYTTNLLACTTGLRIGEVLALRKSDICETYPSILTIIKFYIPRQESVPISVSYSSWSLIKKIS
ncbi:MAG: hypothetical protein Ta2B_15000 [Termitinemataceae bacterium]|nr:MAG: hypothetical protein Ta2B_15000 [Termitinemataceae bacterium]